MQFKIMIHVILLPQYEIVVSFWYWATSGSPVSRLVSFRGIYITVFRFLRRFPVQGGLDAPSRTSWSSNHFSRAVHFEFRQHAHHPSRDISRKRRTRFVNNANIFRSCIFRVGLNLRSDVCVLILFRKDILSGVTRAKTWYAISKVVRVNMLIRL